MKEKSSFEKYLLYCYLKKTDFQSYVTFNFKAVLGKWKKYYEAS